MGHEQVRDLLLDAIGRRVRALRLEAGMTVRDFAESAELSPRFAHQLEAGEGNISIAGLARVAAALGCSLPELIPPASDDHSLRADVWRLLSDSSGDDLEDLQQWLEQRKGGEPKARFIALIGLRGAGKSTIGRLLARRLKTEFVELDRLVEEAADMSLGEVFATHGEGYYRRLERESIRQLIGRSGGCVLAPGGSVVSDPESWELVRRRCFTVWLHATPAEFMKRMRRQGDLRPMQGRPSAMDELKALLARREPLYAESRLKIRTTNKTPAAVVALIAKALSGQV
ncbi:MAG TPA: shikimate kinase [Blastocatellia bacterium]|jgi:XRE family aerobic/anaerobic benzoate catabolism transcriptional regulator|nr:shikimate kinase [Blastocatellia bacterium]